MPSSDLVRFGIVGGGWVANVHAQALTAGRGVTLGAVADVAGSREGRTGRGAALAARHGGIRHFDDHRRLLDDPSIDAVVLCVPNHLHAPLALEALRAKKHVVIEKPLCLRLDEADEIGAVAHARGLVVGYAEELCFAPKLHRARELVRQGAIGELFFLKQVEAHGGPYSDWFFDPLRAGGGALMDLGCHSIEVARWAFDKRPARKVTALLTTQLHRDRGGPEGLLEDHAVIHLELEGGAWAALEAGWALQGGMESTARFQGAKGLLDVDLSRGNGLKLYSLDGVPAETLAPGWNEPDFEWLWQNGYAQELEEFANAIRDRRAPVESVADGRAVLEILWAAYASAAAGCTIDLPFKPDPKWRYPAEPWLASRKPK